MPTATFRAARPLSIKRPPLGNDVWQVSYVSGDYASREVAQSRWLYRCALLALEQGYEGFEVVSEIPLTNVDLDASPLLGYQAPRAQSFQPVYLATEDAAFEADIRLLPAVAAATPPKTFDAQALKRALEVIVHPQQTAQVDIY